MDKQIIDEERMFECVWCKYGFKESDANFILSENPNECVCSGCITEWADNLLCDLKRKEQELQEAMDNYVKLDNQRVKEYNELVDLYKAKEQECEELKAKLIKWLGKEGLRQSEKEFYEQQLDQLKAENDELKRQHQGDKGLITSTGKMNYQLLQEYDKLKTENDELKKKCNIYTCGICGNKDDCNKLYKTLTEIKNKLTVHKTLYYESKLIEKLHKEILQKISECEVE